MRFYLVLVAASVYVGSWFLLIPQHQWSFAFALLFLLFQHHGKPDFPFMIPLLDWSYPISIAIVFAASGLLSLALENRRKAWMVLLPMNLVVIAISQLLMYFWK